MLIYMGNAHVLKQQTSNCYYFLVLFIINKAKKY
jgi:hypothetical protein